jgi:hypothetical protein
MRWSEFEEAAPRIAGLARVLIESKGVAMLGTLRADDSPRISPCEVFFVDGDLMVGMMWRSRKAVDLLRDPRIVVHSATSARDGAEGDAKLYGRVVDVAEPWRRRAYGDELEAKIAWRPTEPFHLFALDVQGAAFIRFGAEALVLRWAPSDGEKTLRHPGQ